MLNINEVMEILGNEYTIDLREIEKNGTIQTGYSFRKEGSNIAPTVYNVEQFESIEELKQTIERAYTDAPVFVNPSDLISLENIKANSFVALQKPSTENLVKKSFLDLEEYIRIKVDNGTFKLTEEHLARIDIDLDTLFSIAESNTFKQTTRETLAEKLGLPSEFVPPMYYVSNTDANHGASAVIDKQLLKDICTETSAPGLYILPSSIHEMLLIPDNGEGTKEMYDSMVKTVNENEVAPSEQLADHSYYYNVATEEITY